MIDKLLQDLRYALRALRAAPGFAAVAVLTIGLGIGANTAIFSVVNAVLLRPLPYEEPDRLVFIRGELRARDVFNWPISPRILLDMRERSTLIESFAGVTTGSGTMVTGEGDPVQLEQAFITPNMFATLGVSPVWGRGFTDEDAAPIAEGTDPATVPTTVVLLSHRLWRTRFGSDTAIIGRTIEFNGNDVEVIGVMPPGFKLLLPPDAYASSDIDVWLAPRLDLVNFDRRQGVFDTVARLAEGVTIEQAQAEMDVIAAWEREISESAAGAGYALRVVAMQSDVTAGVRPIVLALLGAVGFVLLIACANVSRPPAGGATRLRVAHRERRSAAAPRRRVRQPLSDRRAARRAGHARLGPQPAGQERPRTPLRDPRASGTSPDAGDRNRRHRVRRTAGADGPQCGRLDLRNARLRLQPGPEDLSPSQAGPTLSATSPRGVAGARRAEPDLRV